MEVIKTPIEGCYELQPKIFADQRGRLVKTFHDEIFAKNGLDVDFKEEYYSTSKKGVLRGLHFQLPPHDHVKCVTCLHGKIFDVVVDLRKNSKTYKQYYSLILDSEKGNMLYVPKGLAHGFYVLSDEAIFLNRSNVVYKVESDFAIRWNSCNIEWPNNNPIVSDKDMNCITFEEFIRTKGDVWS
ncbi:MAG: dTDP-4-dehydrorhamnose 3,5-epimerase [Flavobacteriaceae bacterium]|nr:dTDP-4-dehydrorhamnose 3,5-epimerase [Flavobacteriaceae bacterium]